MYFTILIKYTVINNLSGISNDVLRELSKKASVDAYRSLDQRYEVRKPTCPNILMIIVSVQLFHTVIYTINNDIQAIITILTRILILESIIELVFMQANIQVPTRGKIANKNINTSFQALC
ncbi:Hypothetical_protein [Hexamita inflata]|uniref:Hypothetical_protein n=1 Tax=Hexamita inflata TaxID=28002 RepID=A0AA86UKH5_9EUKA|nr:Hypothetical protein HINF_LOCUS49455 [Hexamita inflata]CAI9973408.1 Hypothetical protein HINF_LOCUS61053 [Hexamita inflata]